MAKTVMDGDIVSAVVTAKLENDQVVLESTKEKPYEFSAGGNDIFRPISTGVVGMQPGEKKTFRVEPNQAFGEVDPRKVIKVETTNLPQGIEVGTVLRSEENEQLEFVVEKIEGGNATINGNHPLAGLTLLCDIEILDVRTEGGDDQLMN